MAAAAKTAISRYVGQVEPGLPPAGTPAPIRSAAGLTPGTLEAEPKPFSEWIEDGLSGDPGPPWLPTGNTGAASRRALSRGIW